ncbi:DUF882 domain-containing protein [Xanthobacter sp. DSM 24535]|uniref:DUF882 domain-containing protein n=1 Tax=Roseixanthobacter psychrophilus TaxID=3119917 RepID=UPI0037284C1B
MSLGFEPLQKTSRSASPTLSRAALARGVRCFAIAVAVVAGGATSLQNAVANGDTRTIYIQNMHTGEKGAFTFKKEGRYDPEVLKKLNWILRDWRKDEPTDMDPQLFDLIWEVYREVDATESIHVVCGYRSPATNAMLRARSKGVAQQSQHTRGKAMDFYIPGVNLADLRAAGLRLQRGGVGFYPTSGSPFVHMDTGGVRMWPRMTHDQLVKVFPDGKTVHIPADGKPLVNYNAAVAELEARGTSAPTMVASNDAGKGIKNFFSALFGKKGGDEDEGADEAPPARTQVATAKTSPVKDDDDTPAPTRVAAAPLPSARPVEIAATLATAQVTAQATLAPLPLKRPNTPAPAVPVQTASLAPVPLPAVITRGTDAPIAPALGYASANDPMGGMPQNLVMSAGPQPRLREKAKAAEIPFGRMFLAPSLTAEPYLRAPEMRVFTAFLTAPREVVAMGFSYDATAGLSTQRFSGPAIASLPTYMFASANVRLTERLP